MTRNWLHERWRKQYLREPLQECLWPLMARALREYLRMVAEDDGTLLVGVVDPVAALTRALRVEPDEAELVRGAVELLLEQRFLAFDGGRLWLPTLPESQVWPSEGRPAERETRPKRDVASERDAITSSPSPAPEATRPRSSTERVRAHRERRRQENEATVVASGPPVSSTFQGGVSGAVSSVTDAVSGNVSSSRGDRNLDPSQSVNSQKDRETDLHPHPRLQPDASVSAPVSPAGGASVSAFQPEGVSSFHEEDGEGDEDDEEDAFEKGLNEALGLPIHERAALIAEKPDLAKALEPHKWTEIVAVATALAQAEGRERALLASYESDRGVQNLIALYAAGATQEELVKVASTVPKEEWWAKSKNTLGLESLSINVVRRHRPKPLARARPSERVAKVLAWLAEEQRVAG